MRLVHFSLVILFLIIASPCSSCAAADVPDIYLYVNDLADPSVLLSSEIADIENICYELDKVTGVELAVLIVNTTLPLGVDMYAFEVFEKNGIGKEGEDNGVLVLVSMDEMAWRIEVGYGLEHILNDAKIGRIGRDNIEWGFAYGDHYLGIYGAVLDIAEEIVENYEDDGGKKDDPEPIYLDKRILCGSGIIMILVLLATKGRVLTPLLYVFKRGRFGGGRSGGGGASGRV